MLRNLRYTLNTTTPDAPVPTIHYELTNHLGNVMAVITDEPTATETPAVESLTDYYPFGMTMPGRSYNAHTLRHGFTGHEKESDLSEGIYTTEYRLYDARVGRWLSVDPMWEKYAGMSPYNYCAGNPVVYVDPDGKEKMISFDTKKPNDIGKDYKRWEKNLRLKRNAEEYIDSDPKAIIHIFAHGNPKGFRTENGDRIDDVSSFYTFLEDNHNKKNGDLNLDNSVIVLHSCSTGKGENSFAQNMSELFQVLIIAPSDDVLASMHSETIKNKGFWKVFFNGKQVDTINAHDEELPWYDFWSDGYKATQLEEYLKTKTGEQWYEYYKKKYEDSEAK